MFMRAVVDEGGDYDGWVEEVLRLVEGGGGDFTREEIAVVLGDGWRSVFDAGETAADAASLMRSLILDNRRHGGGRPGGSAGAGPHLAEFAAGLIAAEKGARLVVVDFGPLGGASGSPRSFRGVEDPKPFNVFSPRAVEGAGE